MKKLLLLLPFVAFFSCKMEIPKEQFVIQMKDQCTKVHYKTYLGDDATEAQKDSFCDCFAEAIVGDKETLTMGDAMKAGSKENQAKLADCKKAALADKKVKVEEPTVTEGDLDAAKKELEKVTEEH